MSAASLLAAGRRFHAAQFPATIRIRGVDYSASTSGLVSSNRLDKDGGYVAVRTVSFWLPAATFATPPVASRDVVTWNGAEYLLREVTSDGAGVTLTLRCEQLPQ